MLILGINAYHADAAAVLVRDGQVIGAVAEERLNRIKHCAGFPTLAVREVLRMAGVSLADIHHVAVARDTSANLKQRLSWVVVNLHRSSRAVIKRLAERSRLRGLEDQLCEACNEPRSHMRAKIHRVEHHLAHAASAFYPSSYERAAILTLDGFGDFASTMLAVGEGRSITPLARVTYPHSLGMLYTMVCQFIGFDRYGDEGKVMGLAPYGEPAYADFFRKLVRFTDSGFELDLRFFNHHTQGVVTGRDEYGSPFFPPIYTAAMAQTFGPARARGAEVSDRDRNLAASLQQRLEEAFLHLAGLLHKRTGLDALCLAGGVALNGVANGRLLEESPFKRIYVQSAAGDDGTALGAALAVSMRAGEPRRELQHAYFGPSYPETEIAAALEALDDSFEATQLDEDELCARTAELIAAGNVVGWFQGAMEWGPRALGNRSIVAHPGHPGMKDILNARIKQREPFRPFAPSIKAERVADYFESSHESPFMLMVYRTRPEKYAELCSVDHIDHTGRVQTVTREQNPRYWKLLDAFERVTGTPVLLNTSFNENEPIVCTPAQALDCFRRTRMDAVVLGNTLLTRRETACSEAGHEQMSAHA